MKLKKIEMIFLASFVFSTFTKDIFKLLNSIQCMFHVIQNQIVMNLIMCQHYKIHKSSHA